MMNTSMTRRVGLGVGLIALVVLSNRGPMTGQAPAPAAAASTGGPNQEWRTYGGDLASTRYSPLDQINAGNFDKLEVAWRFRTDSLGRARREQPPVHAADGRRQDLHDGRHTPGGGRARRGHAARCSGCTA